MVRRKRPWLSVVLCILVLVSGYLIGGTLPAFADGVDAYRQALVSADADLQRADRSSVAIVAARLRTIDDVTLSDGSVIHPDNSDVLAALGRTPPDLAAARAGIEARLVEVDSARRYDRPPTFADARERLGTVLARPEFQPEAPPDAVSASLNRLWRAVVEGLLSLLRDLFSGGGESGRLPVLSAVAIGLGVVAAVVVVIVRSVRQSVGPGVANAEVDVPPGIPTAEETRREASRLARSGAFRAAIRALYLACLLRWDEQGRLRFDRSRTNQEVLEAARSQGDAELAETLRPLVERFDLFWYGGLPCTDDDYSAFVRLSDQAWEAA